MSPPAPRLLVLEVRNDLDRLGAVLDEVEAFLRSLNIARDASAQVMLIVDELASNVAKYAWPEGGEHSFALRLRAAPDQALPDGALPDGAAPDGAAPGLRLTIELEDDGVAFDPSASPDPDLDAPLDARSEGGLGWLLVRSLTDEFAHRRVGGRNHLMVGKLAQLA